MEVIKLPNRPITSWHITVKPKISDSIAFDRSSNDGDGCGIFTGDVQNVPGLIIQALQTAERKYIG